MRRAPRLRGRMAFGAFVVVGLLVALALAVFLSPEASSEPDGLAKVAADHGLDAHQEAHALGDGPTAGYEVDGVHDRRLSRGLAGAIGVTATFAATGGLLLLVRRRADASPDASPARPADGIPAAPPGRCAEPHADPSTSRSPSGAERRRVRGVDGDRGGGVAQGLHHDGDSAVHRLAPEVKVAATLAFVLAVVATPAHAAWAFGVDAAVVVAAAAAARLPLGLVLRRLRIELPFLAFAVALPLVGRGPHRSVLGLHLSEPGLWGAWNIVAKGTLGVLAAIVLAATTPIGELLAGLRRLRVPVALTTIAGLMVRYLDVIVGEAARMRVARLSRADDPRWLWQARGVAATGGTLFVRAYERGERVHLAMLARGYDGTAPDLHHHERTAPAWLGAVAPLVAVAVLVAARVTG